MGTIQDFYQKISSFVGDITYNGEGTNSPFRKGPLEVNNFSICFWMEQQTKEESEGFYVKIPKSNFYLQPSRSPLPITDEDKAFARGEYESLLCLEKYWNNGSADVRFIKPLAFLEECNAIITKREYASDAFPYFRRWDLRARIGGNKAESRLKVPLQKLAEALARFHAVWATPGTITARETIEKIRGYCCDLESTWGRQGFLSLILKRLESLGDKTFSTEMTRTLKGLDVRNILMDHSGHLVLLDPGAMKLDCREADLARFLVTLKILYWGHVFFGLGMVPKSTYSEAFIRAYYGKAQWSEGLISLLMIKELLKQWRMAHMGALAIKPWPSPMKRVMGLVYIDPFYRLQIKKEVRTLERICGV
jgi:hypothetical protein